MGRARELANLFSGGSADINVKTSDGGILNLQTSDTTVVANDVVGAVHFQAPDEGSGTDSILLASKIEAIAEGTFSASSNATSLVFSTASSAAAGTVAGKMTFTSGGELVIKDTDTADGSSPTITLQSGDTDIAQDDVLGTINFQAPDEGTGTDAILVAAGIAAVSEGDFSSSSNATKLSFKTGASEAAAEKMSLSSAGLLTVSGRIITDDTTDATSTTDGSLQTDGGLSVAKDAVIGNDLLMLSDSAVIKFGADSEITLTHSADAGLLLKHAATADDSFPTLTLQTGDTDIAQGDVLGRIAFQAPDEGTGTDAILVPVNIEAVSQGDFSSSNNATSLVVNTSVSAAAGTAGDGGKFSFVGNGEFIVRSMATGDGNFPVLSMNTGETDIQQDDVIGFIGFQAPDEATGTDANLICAGIEAKSEGDFSSSSNATSLVFKTGKSEAATEKARITSNGTLEVEHSDNTNSVASFINGTANDDSNGVVYVKQSSATNNPTMVIQQVGGGGNPSDTQGLHIKMVGQNQGTGRSLRVTTENSNLNSGTAYDPLLVENGGVTRFAAPGGNGNINFYNNNLYLQSNSGEVYATDSGGNHSLLSPHNFKYIPEGKSADNAWSYLSEKVTPRKEVITKTIDGEEITEETGEMLVTREKDDEFTYVNVDMMKVVREVEKLTGTKLIYTGTNGKDDGSTVKDDIIAGLIKRIEALESA